MIHLGSIAKGTGKATEAETTMAGMEPVGRMSRPEEVAPAVGWLCSVSASLFTGIAVSVDGGFVAP